MISKRLSKPEWDQLDKLLAKHGFGGYYDLVESIRYPLSQLGIGSTGLDISDPSTRFTLPEIVSLLSQWATALSNTDGFQNLTENAVASLKER